MSLCMSWAMTILGPLCYGQPNGASGWSTLNALFIQPYSLLSKVSIKNVTAIRVIYCRSNSFRKTESLRSCRIWDFRFNSTGVDNVGWGQYPNYPTILGIQ
ncbi:hypothetical protein HOY80DRAFT_945990 [Tuber brumale]|nr:hypothetical protein HOY80DRAFT_945990 [Tuber brumale]